MDLDLRVAEEAAKRWWDRQQERKARRTAIDAGRISEIESPERIKKRVDRLTEATLKRKVERSVAGSDRGPSLLLTETIGLERVLGKSDFLGTDFLEMALAVSRFVGRINIRSRPGRPVGFGTGFMVSPRLLLTNNHVLQTGRDALYSEVEFDYQYDRYGRLLPVVAYGLEPETFFITSKELDFTLVAVRELSLSGVDLKTYGWSPLIGAQGKALLGDSLNIIQHPRGEAKQIVLRSNQLLDLFDDFAHYVTDTEPGSSGSPVYNDEWEVVALHHSGVPKMQDGNYIAKDGSIWRRGMDPGDLEWVANEGIRVSSLLDHVKKARLTGGQGRLREEMLNGEPPNPLEAAAMAKEDTPPAHGGQGSFTWTIPLHVTVSLGTSSPAISAATDAQGGTIAEPSDRPPTTVGEEAISIDPNYGNRKGYDPTFLGDGAKSIPLPNLSDLMKVDVAVNTQAVDPDEYVLPYNHFSVVMNKRRKLAFFTAVNIDGNLSFPIRRDTDKWFVDPRIGEDEQTGEAVYANNPLDRGHLVRRLDPAWADSEALAKVANDDTFHFTNCSPQHENFNQNRTTWAGLEDYILDNAIAHDLRVSVFTGPVLSPQDPQYRGVQLPRQYWKVVAMVKDDGALSATAYLLSQESLLGGLEEFSFADYKTFQVPVRRVEELTGLDFGDLKEADPADVLELAEREALGAREIVTLEDLTL
ncbi:MAG TPA: DNA/RNA non-specific endonuclease [Rubrobacter sp.]|nr:DNA/RNA non-specific endonuclease [Rubrobacter sp.]